MNHNIYKNVLLSAAALLATSCSSVFNGPEHALTVADEHPISVDSQVVTLTIDVDGTTSDISDIDRARLRAFADSYLIDGHGPLTITAPSGTLEDFEGHEAAADIRQALNDAGVPWSTISGATYRTASGDQLIISYTHYVATASECGVWSGLKERDYRNLRSPNMGCATMNNYAAMIADPHDLVAPADAEPGDAAAAVRAIEQYRAGDVTVSEIDGEIDTSVSE